MGVWIKPSAIFQLASQKKIQLPDIGEVLLVKRRRQKNLRLSLQDGTVRVSMPYYTPFAAGKAFALSKKDWIIKHKPAESKLYSGMHIGKSHRLTITGSQPNKSSIRGGEIVVSGSSEHIRKTVNRALKKEASHLLPHKVKELSARTELQYTDLIFKHLKGRWGSCSSERVLTFNVLLMQLPWHLIEYVIVHELCHTTHMNHSQDFWSLVERHYPDYKQARNELRTWQPIIYNTGYGKTGDSQRS